MTKWICNYYPDNTHPCGKTFQHPTFVIEHVARHIIKDQLNADLESLKDGVPFTLISNFIKIIPDLDET